ncbi:hypothetical protein V1511DRAFT_494874 [Dipodascopsis uninucleata]
MVQGTLKPNKSKKISKPAQQAKKAAKKTFAPRKSSIVTSSNLKKKHSAGIASGTERLLSSRVGHLELLKGSRREIEKVEREKKRKEKSGQKK